MRDAKRNKALIVDQTSVWSNALPRRDREERARTSHLTEYRALSPMSRGCFPRSRCPMMPRHSRMEKSSVYFGLLDACEKDGCPVCRIMEEASASYLDTLFYEQVTDVGVRRKLRQARGLCNWHSGRVRHLPTAALGVAIIAQDLLEEEIARLAGLQRRPYWRRVATGVIARLSAPTLSAYLRGRRQRHSCPACQAVGEHERHALETILNFLDEEVFAQRFHGTAFGVCLPHLVRVAECHPSHPGLVTLIAVQRGKYAGLIAELEEFCRKHDYRFSHEAWGLESDAWQRAIEVLAGKAGLFGNDLQHQAVANADLDSPVSSQSGGGKKALIGHGDWPPDGDQVAYRDC